MNDDYYQYLCPASERNTVPVEDPMGLTLVKGSPPCHVEQ